MTFKPGQSGNPAGKVPGSGDQRKYVARLFAPQVPKLAALVLDAAVNGDVAAAASCLKIYTALKQ